MSCIDDTVEPVVQYAPVEFLVREAAQAWERDGAYVLRRAVFCIEQGIFTGDDRDAIDDTAQLLVAMSCIGGMPDQVVGTVRIHSPAPGLWWGSRLAVHPAFRSQGHLGATLIRLAVSRAHAQGCETFLAHVQSQNVPLFRKLGWHSLGELAIHGRAHTEMQADLGRYPPCHDAVSGFVSRARSAA
ncbi:GNAT family N-acetyltransferase [Variovorax sp. J22G21]|uniref:MSMEG_0567/Sll0786 family nitrogen starvation N-acetyltransferase n=1 Tax=Variovorax fucosicus TaxID=3053517 RepID=UPI002575A405|nr:MULTISPECIES: MSMEG_0567/Sll0786 family nitrogen starvation N-acetyltransferase [unclassified Variovorax]MDM0042579.1 GNAT family N-acetyltransferase [Variovorax sp. J22R193]MDM0054344.1 GNAT family N-acetyltransferase [Variovorax sp. J22G47]MDM0061184.1 GNAT family N-acetyltransferase [Variovorax sp. J22G21]